MGICGFKINKTVASQKDYSVTDLGPRSAVNISFFLSQHFQLWKMERRKEGRKQERSEGGTEGRKKEARSTVLESQVFQKATTGALLFPALSITRFCIAFC